MARVLMQKEGQADLLIEESLVSQHERLGWSVVEGSLGTNGDDFTVVRNPVVTGTLQALLARHYQIAPAAISASAIHAAITLTGAAQNISSGITQPDYPRTLTIKGNASGMAGNVVLQGLNVLGEPISETIALSGASEVEGTLAFASLSLIQVPAKTNGSGDTISIGRAKKFGIPHELSYAEQVLVKLFDGSADAGTMAPDADEIEKNLFALAGTPNGTKLVDLFYLA